MVLKLVPKPLGSSPRPARSRARWKYSLRGLDPLLLVSRETVLGGSVSRETSSTPGRQLLAIGWALDRRPIPLLPGPSLTRRSPPPTVRQTRIEGVRSSVRRTDTGPEGSKRYPPHRYRRHPICDHLVNDPVVGQVSTSNGKGFIGPSPRDRAAAALEAAGEVRDLRGAQVGT